jgi:hypothetical protein
MNRVAFYGGLFVLLVGLLVWILRPNQAAGKFEAEFFDAKFSFDTPAFAVMVIGLAMMLFSTRFPQELEPAPVKKIVCTGETEGNCLDPTIFSIHVVILVRIKKLLIKYAKELTLEYSA